MTARSTLQKPANDPAPGSFDLDAFVPYRLAVAARRISLSFARIYREQFGLTIPEWRVLAHLANNQVHGVSVREIHERADMDKSKVSRAAARLEQAGYVAKRSNTEDRRLVVLHLTEEGRALMDQITPLAQAFQREVLATLGQDAAGFESALDRIIGAQNKTSD